jgi:uncharacterized protein with GYD domain
MATYLMFGRYTPAGMAEISSERTRQAIDLIKRHGGKVKDGYALLGEKDLVLITEFRKNENAMQAAAALSKLTNITISTSPAVPIDDFDKMMSEI